MSQRELSRSIRIERTCEGCGKKVEFEVINTTPAERAEMEKWHTIIREAWVPEEEGWTKLMVQACSIPCLELAALKMQLLPEEPADSIDLGSLRVGKPQVN
jgi:hypothetical protein